jgi:6-phosphogluconolactonase (cycloisomerase 2 family)
MRRTSLAAFILILSAVSLWQGCDSGGNGSSGGGKSIGGGTTATYLVYVDPVAANVNVDSVPTSGTLAAATGSPYMAGSQPVNITASVDGRFVYVMNSSSGNVNVYAVAKDGILTQPVPPVATGQQPSAMAIDSLGRFAVVTNRGSNSLSIYTINTTTGALTASGSAVSLNVSGPKAVAANGDFVFVANSTGIDVLLFNSTTGTFSFGAGSSVGSPSGANYVALYAPPQATAVLYALDSASNAIVPFTVSNTGQLTAGASIAAGSQPAAMVADSTNHFLYVANLASNNVSAFAINASTGALTPASPGLTTTSSAPSTLAYDSVNHFLFVGSSNPNQVQVYTANTTSGALTAIGTPLAVTNAPAAMVVAKP